VNILRRYGRQPFNLAVIHGGPGAPGEMAPVARELSPDTGVLEPLQTAATIEGQVEELKNVLEKNGNPPLVLIGFSWGAWLSYILTARYPRLIRKLVLVSSGPFEERYAAQIMTTRFERLSETEKQEALALMEAMQSGSLIQKTFDRFGELMGRADSCDPLPADEEVLECSPAVYQTVWEEASRLRSSGRLLQMGESIPVPVVAIHGDYDPHPWEGVKDPLSRVIKDFRFILLENCGHHPWLERQACETFYQTLRREIGLYPG
jgi:pimeloyl-ACP methyl ester carboxylesterase